MGKKVNTFRQLKYLEDWKDAFDDFQDKIARRLDLTSTTALHLTKIVKGK